MSKLSMCKTIFLLCAFCGATAIGSPAQTFTNLLNFDGTDGAWPDAPLVQGTDGNFYGTTDGGGAYGNGTVFKTTAAGKLTTLYSFCPQTGCMDGYQPSGPLVQGTDGNFYGTTPFGGANDNCGYPGCGTVFKITPTGKLTTLYNFCSQTNCSDGALPFGGLVQAANGNFYGTTSLGGTNDNAGTVFKITPAGTLTTLYDFCSQNPPYCTDGAGPTGTLIQAPDGNLYGTTAGGGSGSGGGTVFKITPAGKLTTLATVGGGPNSAVVQGTDGNFYGTTAFGFTIFKMTPGGKLTTLHTFDGTDGAYPYAGLVQATNGNFYGTTYVGGANNYVACEANGCGTAFEITPEGMLTTLYNFCSQPNCTDGYWPLAGLMQATNGNIYGTTFGDGNDPGALDFYGSVFSLGVGLGPFVETRPTSGRVGTKVTILGNNLKGSTSVTFNGVAANPFTVNSTGTAITTTVPNGATTGKVQVTTPHVTLTSNVKFRVP